MTQNWVARVEWTPPAKYTDAELGDLIEALAEHSPAIGLERDGRATATISVDAGTLRQALASALSLVEEATGSKADGVEILEEGTFDERSAAPTIPDLVSNADIADMLGVSRQRAAQLTERADFPPEVAHPKSGPLRIRQHVEAWARTWARTGGRPKAKA